VTQPAPAARPVTDPYAQPLLDAQALALELAAAAAVTATLVAGVATSVALLRAGDPRAAAASLLALARRGAPATRLAVALETRLPQARQLGWEHSRAVLRAQRMPVDELPPAWSDVKDEILGEPWSDITDHVLETIDDRAREDLGLAAVEIRRSDGAATDELIVKMQRPAGRAGAAVREAANATINAGAQDAARVADVPLVWVAERDACLTCLALSGQVAAPGGMFADLTFDDQPLRWSGWSGGPPPRHPRCRCRAWPYDGGPPVLARSVSGAGYSTALAREARRSVARGWSGSAGLQRRLRAAERMIGQGTAALPRTVVDRARRDVARGEFSDRHARKVPRLRGGTR